MTAVLEKTVTETYDEWGSLITAVPPAKLAKKFSPRAQNVWVDNKPGAITTVEGHTKVGDLPSGNPCRFMYTFAKSDGTQVVLCSDNATVWKTSDFVTFTSIITGLSESFQLRAATLRDKVWLTNGNDSVRTYDGTNVVVLDGTSSTPDVPSGKFIEVWHERVWIGDIPSNRSAVRFSALTDSSGADIAPDHASAWPNDNELHFGQDDGDVVTGMKEYLGRLHVFKTNSIWRVQGSDEFSYEPFRTTATTGCRLNESIQERDNLLEFIGKNGVYEFDGNDAKKISSTIESLSLDQFSFLNIQQTAVQPKSKAWTSQSDFEAGTLTRLSATRVPGSLVIENDLYDGVLLPASSDPVWTKTQSGTNPSSEAVASSILTLTATAGTSGSISSFIRYARTATAASNATGWSMITRAKMTSSGANHFIICYVGDDLRLSTMKIYPGRVDITNSSDSVILTYAMTTTDDYHVYQMSMQGDTVSLVVDGVSRGSASNSVAYGGSPTATFGLSNLTASTVASATIDYVSVFYGESGEIVSDIYQITDTITAWGAFQATYANNGGTVAFYIRGATTSGGVSGQSWTAITPGAAIALATTSVYVQFRTVLTRAASDTRSPTLEDVTINWTTGTASAPDQLVGSVVYDDRYWLAAALEGSSHNDVIVVRGKREYDAPWMRLHGFNLLAFTIYNNELYASASDSDNIYRLGVGNSLNGAALDSYWETRDEVAGVDEDVTKQFLAITITGQRSGNYSLTVDISLDGGATFPAGYQRTISLAGSGRFTHVLRYATLQGKQCRVRVRTNGIDTPFEIHSIKLEWRRKNLR